MPRDEFPRWSAASLPRSAPGTTLRQSARGTARSTLGFTLVEVLVALAIFALGAIVLGSAYVNILTSYDAATRFARTSEDVAFARQIVLNEPDRTKLERGGEFETAVGGRLQWSVTIESTTTADLFKVTFLCNVDEPGKIPAPQDPNAKGEVFYVLRPTWSIDPAEHDKLRQDARTRILEYQQKRGQI